MDGPFARQWWVWSKTKTETVLLRYVDSNNYYYYYYYFWGIVSVCVDRNRNLILKSNFVYVLTYSPFDVLA